MEFAWLGLNKGHWHFYSETLKGEERKWGDRGLAIKELQEEGWSLTTLYYEEGAEQDFCACGLVRLGHL